MCKKAHTLAELLIASAMAILLIASVFGAFMLTKSIYAHGMASYPLQRDVDLLMARIIRGSKEQTGTYGLRSAGSFTIGDFVSKTDFVGTDANPSPIKDLGSKINLEDTGRAYFVSNNTVVYESPTQSPKQQVIYTPPPNSTITLLFWDYKNPQLIGLVGIYISVSQQVGNRKLSGSVRTCVNLRNVPK